MDFSCPSGQPGGYGTVTPDPYWVINCQQCVTPLVETPTPYNGTGTPEITGTPPTTETPVPTGTPQEGITLTLVLADFTNTSSPYVTQTGDLICVNDSPSLLHCSGTVIWEDDSGVIGGDIKFKITAAVNTFYPFTLFWSFVNLDSFENLWLGHQFSGITDIGYIPSFGQWMVPASVSPYDEITFTGSFSTGGSFKGGGTEYVEAYISVYAVEEVATPTPAPTPIPSGYCGSVEPYVEENLCAEGVFCNPVPWIGSTTCPVNVPEFTIPLGVLGMDDIYFPGLTICLTEITFGTMIAWGVVIDLDLIVWYLAVAMVIRILLRS